MKLGNVSYVGDCYDERLTYVADNSFIKGEDLHLETNIDEKGRDEKSNDRHLKYAGEYADQDTMMPAT